MRCCNVNEVLINLLSIVFRTLLSFVFLFLLSRLIGVRQISQLTFYDYIVGITIGSIAATLTIDDTIPIYACLVAMALYAILTVSISIITMKSIKLRRFFSGTPTILIYKGSIIEKSMKDCHYDINDLLCECRKNGYFNISDIEYGIMEIDGSVSILPKTGKRPVQPEDLGMALPQEHLCTNVIIDGKVMEHNLEQTGYDLAWLNKQLKQQKHRTEDVLLGSLETNGTLTLLLKNQQLKNKNYFI